MIRGITPVDGAFELMGLHQAHVVMHFIFLETMAGKMLFALGFILSLRSGLDKGNFKPAVIFLLLFFSLWFLLVLPQARAVDPVSAMERHGYQELTVAEILKKNGYAQIMVNPLADVLSRSIDSLIMAVAGVFEKGAQTEGYLASPFLFIKVSLVTSGVMAQGIRDPELEEKTVNFYQDYFWPVFKKLESKTDNVWPGHEQVVAAYKEEGRSAWQSLREALYQSCDQNRIFQKMFERFYDGKVDKDAVVRSLLMREMILKPGRYTLMTYASELEQGRSKMAGVQRDLYNTALPEKIMRMLPWMQGGALFFLWSALPAFLAMTFLLRKMGPLILFIGVLFSIKAWTLIWVVLDKISTVWFVMDKARGGLIWEPSVVNSYIALAAFVLPLVMTAGVVVLDRRINVEGMI